MKKILNLVLCLFLLCSCTTSTNSQIDTASAYANQYQGFTYYRDQLNQEEQNIYDTIYYHLSKRDDSYGVEAKDKDTLFQLYEYVLADHPEIFWEDGSNVSYTESTIGGKTTFEIYASKQFNDDTVRAYEKQLNDVTEPILKKVQQMDSDYEKVKYIYDYIIDHTSYQENSIHNQTILSVFLYQSSVCAGYAKSIQYLLSKAGIPCTYLWGGTTYSSEDHAWNMVNMDGEYYYLDATNGDSDEDIDKRWRYSFFTMNTKQMLALFKPIPKYINTNAVKDSYFYHNDALLDNQDLTQIQSLLNKEASQSSSSLIFQCENRNVCEVINEQLQNGNTLFDMAQQEGMTATTYQSYHQAETNTWLYVLQ